MSPRRIAARRRIHFIDRTDELDFASPVAMALRGYKRQEFLEVVDREAATRAFKWRIRDYAARRSSSSAAQRGPAR